MSPPLRNPASRMVLTLCVLAVTGSLVSSLVLLVRHRVLSGPGDQLAYYTQAAQLLPFTDHFYGPGYFVALRLVHDLTGLEWFTAGKLLSWVSAGGVLLSTWLLSRQLLGREPALFVVTLVALNPVFIDQSYSSLTIMFGAVVALGAIVATTLTVSARWPLWCLCGLLFGLASLTRFQNSAFLVGAVGGTLLAPSMSARARVTRAAGLTVGGALPMLLWNLLLHTVQGGPPANHNYVHLTVALGEFEQFSEVPSILAKYESMWGVLTADWTTPLRIAAFAVKEAVKFPFTVGFQLLFLAAGWLVPGLVMVARRRGNHGPWLGAFLCGLLLTGIGSREITYYFLPFLPFVLILVIVAIRSTDRLPFRARWWPSVLRWISPSCALILVSTVAWSPIMVSRWFRQNEWTELEPARRFLMQNRDRDTIVTSTAASIVYGTPLKFLFQDSIVPPNASGTLMERLREHKVTYLVVIERHSLYEYPGLKSLLQDQVPDLPSGLRRELLVTDPMRLAVYRVLAP